MALQVFQERLEGSIVYDHLRPEAKILTDKNVKEYIITKPMLRKRFLVDVLGLAKKFHIFVGESSRSESNVRRELADETLEGFESSTSTPAMNFFV